MSALGGQCIFSMNSGSVHYPNVSAPRPARLFGLTIATALCLIAFSLSAISPEDDVIQRDCIHSRMPAQSLSRPEKSHTPQRLSVSAVAPRIVTSPCVLQVRETLLGLLSPEVDCCACLKSSSLNRAPPSTS